MSRVWDGGPWRGISTDEQVERIARGSTPVREYVDGEFRSWINPTPRREPQSDLAGFGEPRSRDGIAASAGSPEPGLKPAAGG